MCIYIYIFMCIYIYIVYIYIYLCVYIYIGSLWDVHVFNFGVLVLQSVPEVIPTCLTTCEGAFVMDHYPRRACEIQRKLAFEESHGLGSATFYGQTVCRCLGWIRHVHLRVVGLLPLPRVLRSDTRNASIWFFYIDELDILTYCKFI